MKRLSRADILNMFGYTAGTKLYNLLYSSCANFCCIVKNCLGISSGGNAGLVLNQQGNWITAGGGGSQNLSSVLSVGNASGANDIVFDDTQGLLFDNASICKVDISSICENGEMIIIFKFDKYVALDSSISVYIYFSDNAVIVEDEIDGSGDIVIGIISFGNSVI